MELTPEHRAFLNKHAITDDVIKSVGIHSGSWGDLTGIIFPWIGFDGRKVDQIRPDNPPIDEETGKPKKYLFPKGSNPPLNFLRQPEEGEPTLLVEGTKQALAALSWARPSWGIVGMFGCRGWSNQDLSWFSGQDVAVIFDGDVVRNPDVHDAAARLYEELSPDALGNGGAKSIRIPVLEAEGTDGLDDVLARTPEAERTEFLAQLCAKAKTEVPEFRNDVPVNYEGPYRDEVHKGFKREYVSRKVRELVNDQIAQETGYKIDWALRSHSGADWLSEEEEMPKPLWGTSDTPLWFPGESLTIVGPPSVGKSTLAHMVMWGALGFVPDVLASPIEPMTDGGILYLAMDRPKQIKRAMARFLRANPERREEILTVLRERLTVWEGPLPGDPTVDKRLLVAMAERFGRTRIIVDSIKDILPNASDETRAGGYNIARQEALAEGIEWIELHHNRKNGADNKEPSSLDDVYGSRWITAGAGSVLSLYGEPGDIVLRMKHIKPLGEPIIPMWVQIERHSGIVTVHEQVTVWEVLKGAGDTGITAEEAARLLYGIGDKKKPNKNQVQNTRNKINRLIKEGKAEEFDGLNSFKRYRLTVNPLGVA